MRCLLGIQMRLQQFNVVNEALSLPHQQVTFPLEILLLTSMRNLQLISRALLIVSETLCYCRIVNKGLVLIGIGVHFLWFLPRSRTRFFSFLYTLIFCKKIY